VLRDHLEAAFGAAQPEHFDWQTSCPYVAEQERELVRSAFTPLGAKVIDLGCGEGATLHHLEATGAVGVDLFPAKTAFAAELVPRCTFVAASVEELPFDDGCFDHVLVRDLVHHLDEPSRMVDEAWRVLEPGGRIDVLEPCRYNPMIAAHALMIPAERGELRSSAPFLRKLLSRRFEVRRVEQLQALPLHRLVFHPSLGSPRLAQRPVARAVVAACEYAASILLPKGVWSYLHLRAVKS
jgi:SAM-dependent methyltransferase